jgi:hypothetical protein
MTKTKGLIEFYEQRSQLLENYDTKVYLLLIIGKKYYILIHRCFLKAFITYKIVCILFKFINTC